MKEEREDTMIQGGGGSSGNNNSNISNQKSPHELASLLDLRNPWKDFPHIQKLLDLGH
jgi:hypothetical protein